MKWSILLFCILIGPPRVSAASSVTVDQLVTRIASFGARNDKYVAHRLSTLHLTERLSYDQLIPLLASLPGDQSRHQLLVLADLSAFLQPPQAAITNAAPPDAAERHRLLSAAADLSLTIAAPDFHVNRSVSQFQNLSSTSTRGSARIPIIEPVPRFSVGGSDTLAYHRGLQIATNSPDVPRLQFTIGVETWDGFGSLVQTALKDIIAIDPKWLYWEQRGSGKLAVFQYAVPEERSNLSLPGCLAQDCEGRNPQYNGELALDSVTGHVYRLTIQARFRTRQPVARIDLVLEFGTTADPKHSFVWPLHGVAFVVAKTLLGYSGANYSSANGWSQATPEWGDVTTMLDVQFSNYTFPEHDAAGGWPSQTLNSGTPSRLCLGGIGGFTALH